MKRSDIINIVNTVPLSKYDILVPKQMLLFSVNLFFPFSLGCTDAL